MTVFELFEACRDISQREHLIFILIPDVVVLKECYANRVD
jgi:hypothetical protein